MHVLIVEDNSSIARFYRHLLEKEGFSTASVVSLQEAAQSIQLSRPDILLLDRILPDGDGSDFCQQLKADPATTSIFVILISGLQTTETDQVSSLDGGADDYLLKPISADLLVVRVRAAVRIKRAQEDLMAINEALHQSEERFRSTFEQAAVGISHIAPNGRYLRVNQRFCEILGYSEEELLQRTLSEITHPDDMSRGLDLTSLPLTGPITSTGIEKRYLRKDGTPVWVQVTASVLTFPDGTPHYLISIVRDITERKATEERLRRSEEAFRALVENTPDVVARYDKELRCLYVNPRVSDLMNFQPADVIGRTNAELPLEDELRQLWDAAIVEVFEKRQELQIEFAMTVRGDLRHFESLLSPEYNARGEVESVLTVTRDVTRRVEAEMDNLRLATVMEQATEGILITSLENEIVYANPYTERSSGYSWAEMKGKTPRLFRSGLHSQEFYTELQQTIRKGLPWRGTIINRRKDGTLYHEAASIFPVMDRYGQILNFASVRRNVTGEVQLQRQREAMVAITSALRQADTKEEILAATSEQVRLLLDARSTAIALAVEDGSSAYVASAEGDFATLAHSSLGAVESVTGYVMTTGEPYVNNDPARDPLLGFHSQQAQTGAVAAVPLIVQRQIIGVLWAGRALAIDDGDLQVLTAIGDIAASALYRADLYAQSLNYTALLEERVIERTRQLAEANAELQVLDEMKSKFVSDVSHELRTPLASMELYLELLERGKPEKRDQYRHALRQMFNRLTQLVEDILDLSRLETQSPRPQAMRLVDINTVAEQVVEVFRPRAEASGLALIFRPDLTVPRLLGDSNQLSRVVTNLLANAINYTNSGRVEVITGRTLNPGALFLQVTDTGVGIAANDLPYVLERFYRGKHGEMAIPGTGLGLTIVKEIVDAYNGKIHIESAEDQGTSVTISLPPAVTTHH